MLGLKLIHISNLVHISISQLNHFLQTGPVYLQSILHEHLNIVMYHINE